MMNRHRRIKANVLRLHEVSGIDASRNHTALDQIMKMKMVGKRLGSRVGVERISVYMRADHSSWGRKGRDAVGNHGDPGMKWRSQSQDGYRCGGASLGARVKDDERNKGPPQPKMTRHMLN